MKLLSLLVPGVLAGLKELQESFNIVREQYLELAGPYLQQRSVSTILGTSIDQIQEYGCWCYFDHHGGRGKGKPVNNIDQLCKELQDGYDCAVMDYQGIPPGLGGTGDETCTPWEVSYTAGIGNGEGLLKHSCAVLNADHCAQYACLVEGRFVINIFNLFMTGDTNFATDPYSHSEGFDPVTGCQIIDGTADPNHECCGAYPLRFPYKPQNGQRGCCGQHTFPVGVQECCSDNVPRLVC